MQVRLSSQLTRHLVETLGRIRHAVCHFEMVAESPINRESRGCKLRTNGVSGERGAPEQKGVLTLRAETKASPHEPPVNFDFAHSLKIGVGDDEWRAAPRLLSKVERYRFKKSVAKR